MISYSFSALEHYHHQMMPYTINNNDKEEQSEEIFHCWPCVKKSYLDVVSNIVQTISL